MIKHLSGKIQKLVLLLSTVVLCCLFVAAFLGIYFLNLQTVKTEMREIAIDVGLERLIDPQYVREELGELAFAAVLMPRQKDLDFEPRICVNQTPGVSDETLAAYAADIPGNGKDERRFPKVSYIIKRKDDVGKAILFFPKREIYKRMLPGATCCLATGLLVLFLLLYTSKRISRLLVKPVEDILKSEKKFVSNASHELKTPLAVIMANADFLEEVMGKEKHLGYIKEEIVRMNHLIVEMLTLARLDAMEEFYDMSDFLLGEAAEEVAYPFESLAFEKTLKLSVDVQEELMFTGDRQQIQKVISILLDNALAYSNPHGEVCVSVYKRAGHAVLEVANTGDEILQDERDALFERFYRQDEHRLEQGNHFGLGLSIAYEIVRKHRGKIRVDSSGGWNRFTVSLPAAGAR